jgi:hypothetical protein
MCVKTYSQQNYAIAVVATVLLIVTGCAGEDPLGRHAISGTVTLNGAPLAQGSISFQPVDGAATASGDVIVDGKFSIEPELGLPAGKFLVQINGVPSGTGSTIDLNAIPGEAPQSPPELVPREWNVDSKEVIEVTENGPFDFSFNISQSKKL